MVYRIPGQRCGAQRRSSVTTVLETEETLFAACATPNCSILL